MKARGIGRGSSGTVTVPSPARSTIEPMDREAVCSYLAETNIEGATLQFCERFDEKSRIWNFSKHAHPFFELLYFLEGRDRKSVV